MRVWSAIGRLLRHFFAADCANYFAKSNSIARFGVTQPDWICGRDRYVAIVFGPVYNFFATNGIDRLRGQSAVQHHNARSSDLRRSSTICLETQAMRTGVGRL